MLTLIDAVSLAGSRAKQNDDCWGLANGRAFVIDGATDLHGDSVSDQRSDASWFARTAAAYLSGCPADAEAQELLSGASDAARKAWERFPGALSAPIWKSPLASIMIAVERPSGLQLIDAGDCRAFIADASGARTLGGQDKAAEIEQVVQLNAGARTSLNLEDARAMDALRASRSSGIMAQQIFGLSPPSGDAIRNQFEPLSKPAYVVLATDGFSALVDVYGVHTPQSLVARALEDGLAALSAELRDIENADSAGAQFPRWKTSDDATALLLRFE